MYLSRQAGSFSGVPQSTVQLWTEKGLVNSTETTGTGIRRQYSKLNCIQIGIVKSLRDKGLSLRSIGHVMKHLIPQERLEQHLKNDHSFLILHLETDRVFRRAQKSVFSFSNDDLGTERKKLMEQWFQRTCPSDCEEIRIVDLSRIAKKVLEKMD